MPNTTTLTVNILAGCGAGKSTMTADVFAKLKWQGIDCEMSLEYAKVKTWENSLDVLSNQIYIFGKQAHRHWIIRDKVPVIVTDSPLLLSIIYDKEKSPELRALVLREFNKCNNLNIFLKRKKKYVRNGRTQTLEEAIELDNAVLDLLKEENIPYIELEGSPESAYVIVDMIKERLK